MHTIYVSILYQLCGVLWMRLSAKVTCACMHLYDYVCIQCRISLIMCVSSAEFRWLPSEYRIQTPRKKSTARNMSDSFGFKMDAGAISSERPKRDAAKKVPTPTLCTPITQHTRAIKRHTKKKQAQTNEPKQTGTRSKTGVAKHKTGVRNSYVRHDTFMCAT